MPVPVAASPCRLALLGAGRIVRLVHLEVLAGLPGTRIVTVADADATARSAAGRRLPWAVVSGDWREALAATDAAAAVICLPNHLHAEAAEAAFARGMHVYLEKPVAISPVEGDRLVEAWRASGRVGMIGFNYRFHPMHAEARRRISAGSLGRLVAVRSTFTSPARPLPEWQRSRSTGGGVLLNLGVHHFDLVRFVSGRRIASLVASVRSVHSKADTAVVQAELEDGVPVQSLLSMSAEPTDCIEVVGEHGVLVLDRLGTARVRFDPARPGGRAGASLAVVTRGATDAIRQAARVWRGRPEPSFAIALRSFVAAVRGETQEFPDLQDGLEALRVADAAERSAMTGLRAAVAVRMDDAQASPSSSNA